MSHPQSLDTLDPPPWGPAPRDATGLVSRCHALRSKPIDDFTVEDLRVMIGQQIALRHLIPVALDYLARDPLAEGDYFPGDLLSSVIRIEPSFWTGSAELAQRLREILDKLPADAELAKVADQQLADDVAAFRLRSI